MRLYYVALVAATILLASVASAATTDSNLAITPDFLVTRALTDGKDDAAAQRSLRVEKAEAEDEEERGLGSNLMTKFQNLLRKGAASTVATKLTPRSKLTEQMLAKQQQYLDVAFTRLKLDKVKGNVFKDRMFKKWVDQRQNFNKKNHIVDDSGIEIVSKYFNSDAKVSAWIDSARLDPTLKSMADKFRSGQLSQWLRTGTHSDDVYKFLNVKQLGKASENRDMWRKYLAAYSKIWVTNGVKVT